MEQQARQSASWMGSVLGGAAVALPFAAALWRAAAGPQWSSDLATVRDHGLVAVEAGGAVSTVLTQALDLLPLGSRSFRAALVSALALAVAAWFARRLGERAMVGAATPLSPLLSTVLAAIGAASAALSPSFQREATVGGGALVAVALVLAGLDRLVPLTSRDSATLAPAATRGWIELALLAGFALAENVPAGLSLLAATAAAVVTSAKRPSARVAPWCALATLLVLGICWAPLALRPLAPRSWGEVGRALSAARLGAVDFDPTRSTALGAWLAELGTVALALALFGLCAAAFREQRRALAAPLVVVALIDLVYPTAAAPQLGGDPLAAVRLLAIAAFSIAAALGVSEIVAFLRGLRIPMAGPAAVLVTVFYLTIAAVTSEEASYAADRSDRFAAEEWSDEALGALPPDAALLVHTSELSWRLWASRVLRGERPDVAIIPVPLLSSGRLSLDLAGEPGALPLVRDYTLSGQASEYALSALADRRPLYVELDRRWTRRLVGHLAVEGAWLRYEPQVLGSADRTVARHPLRAEGRVLAAATQDASTHLVVARTLKEHTAALALVGMRDATAPLLDEVEQLEPGEAFVTTARLRLAHAARHQRDSVELRDLLRFQ